MDSTFGGHYRNSRKGGFAPVDAHHFGRYLHRDAHGRTSQCRRARRRQHPHGHALCGPPRRGSIKAEKLDAASIRADIINVAYISGLELNFTRGRIGGWTVGASTLASSHILLDSGNRRVAVYGAGGSSTAGHRVQIYYNSDRDFGLWASDASGTRVAALGSMIKSLGGISKLRVSGRIMFR